MAFPISEAVRWNVPDRNSELERRLQAQLGIQSLLACVLVARGFDEPERASKFLNPSLDDLGDPKLLPDYGPSRDAILGALERRDRIFVHGDYDVDGVTSAALTTRFLQSVGGDVVVHVPHRIKEGYGIHLDAVASAKESGAKLFLTCDCGVSAIEQVEAATEAGMKVIVTDHHEVGSSLPKAPVVNPHRKGSAYPYANLSGAGVVFRLFEGIAEELGHKKEQYWRAFLDLTVLGTVADVMPLDGENRIITAHGLKQLYNTQKPGLRALIRETQILEKGRDYFTAKDIGWIFGPRLNAAGRIDDAALSLDLLLSRDDKQASEMAADIEQINTVRKEEQARIVEEAFKQVLDEGLHERAAIVIGRENWHPGLVGLVAGKLVEQFRRPSFVMTFDPERGTAKGSARSIPGFHLADCIWAHPELVSGGGHAMAAGFSAKLSDAEAVARAFEAFAGERLTAADFEAPYAAEAAVDPAEVTFDSVEELGRLEPFGCSNPTPSLLAKDMRIVRFSLTKNPLHATLSLRAASGRGPIYRAVAFNQGERFAEKTEGFEANVLFEPTVEEYRGSKSMKWYVRHFEPLAATSPL